MARETLFNILLRQPWWVTLLVAFAMFAVAHAVFPPVAPFMALPFAILGVYIGFRQWRGNAGADAGERLEAIRAMTWEEFSGRVTEAYKRRGYTIDPSNNPAYDFRMTSDGRTTLLQCRRWKVNQVGIGPVRDLANAVSREEASRGICIAAGDFSEPATRLSRTEPVALITGAELVELLGKLKNKKKAR